VNGYRIVRSMDSYRSNVRLLQNVIHQTLASQASSLQPHPHTLMLYYSGNPEQPADAPYAKVIMYQGTGNTIGQVMDTAVEPLYGNKLEFTTVEGTGGYPFVTSFTVPSPYPGAGTYSAPPGSVAGQPFWFYSLNGVPNPDSATGQMGDSGEDRETYLYYPVFPGDVIYWQDIAPSAFGYPPCAGVTPAASADFMRVMSTL